MRQQRNGKIQNCTNKKLNGIIDCYLFNENMGSREEKGCAKEYGGRRGQQKAC